MGHSLLLAAPAPLGRESSAADGAKEAAEAAKQFAFLENTLLKNRTLTIFGEIDKAVAQRTAEKLLALSFESDEPVTLYKTSSEGTFSLLFR